ncbi:MAG: SPOR domain-containing protein [Halanaerobiales bacterium]|nr:SPOR domain-containing protein [Halanaerobiales bacterium]
MAKKNKKKNKSLTFVVIIMAVISVFIGFYVGMYLFKSMSGGETQVAQTNNNISEDNLEQSIPASQDTNQESSNIESNNVEQTESQKTESTETVEQPSSVEDHENLFKIQVGAFSNRENAETFKSELEKNGYQVIIRETEIFRVRVIGKETREETENIEKELINLGYDTFIVK